MKIQSSSGKPLGDTWVVVEPGDTIDVGGAAAGYIGSEGRVVLLTIRNEKRLIEISVPASEWDALVARLAAGPGGENTLTVGALPF